MSALFESVLESLKAQAATRPELSDMGCTLTILRVAEGEASVGHVGDTRIYQLRGIGILTRTIDQTELQHLLDQGIISKRQAPQYRRKHILLSALSPSSVYQLHTQKFDVLPGDRILLLTDGAYGLVPRQEIRDISLKSRSASDFCEAFLKEIENRNPVDDASCVCIDFSR